MHFGGREHREFFSILNSYKSLLWTLVLFNNKRKILSGYVISHHLNKDSAPLKKKLWDDFRKKKNPGRLK